MFGKVNDDVTEHGFETDRSVLPMSQTLDCQTRTGHGNEIRMCDVGSFNSVTDPGVISGADSSAGHGLYSNRIK